MVVVILVLALIILVKSCLDCPGLLPSLCCGETGSEISSYHLEIVYKVNIVYLISRPPHPTCIKAEQASRESSDGGSEVDADTRL